MLRLSHNRRGEGVVLIGLLTGCSEGALARSESVAGDETPLPAWATSASAAWVFEEDPVRTYELALSASDWEHLEAHARDEQYQAASLSVEGQAVGQVGLRFKGSHGTLFGCADGAGNITCPKLSMKIKFNEYDASRRFYGLKRLNFHSIAEPSHLHERLGYRLFREMDVTAPRAAHAWLVVNGEPLGLFAVVENIDGRFTHNHFERGDGNLYKEQWPGAVDPSTLRLETNEEAPDHSAMIQFGNDLAAAAPDELPSIVASYMDVDHLFAYLAVDRAISNWDGITAFYCSGGPCRNHNQFLYQHEGEHHFTLIPWDLDNTFSVAHSFEYVPNALVVPPDCSRRYRVYGGLRVLAPGCDPLLRGLAGSDRKRYEAQQTRLLEGPFDVAGLEAWIDAREEQLTPLVGEDTHGPGLSGFRTALAALRRDIRLLALRLRGERDGEDTRSFRVDVETGTDFETASPLGIQLGALGQAAPKSSFEVALGGEGALGGARDLELSFTFRDGFEPRSQWARFTLRFDSPQGVDLTPKSALRLVVQADAPRTLRISFGSSNYSQVQTGTTPTLGWDVLLDGTRQELELPLSAVSFPESGSGLPDTLSSALSYGISLLFDPLPEGLENGYLGANVTDSGRIRVDEIRFLP